MFCVIANRSRLLTLKKSQMWTFEFENPDAKASAHEKHFKSLLWENLSSAICDSNSTYLSISSVNHVNSSSFCKKASL